MIGASSSSEKEKKTGWVGRLVQFGYKGEIYPVNPKVGEVMGFKAYPFRTGHPWTRGLRYYGCSAETSVGVTEVIVYRRR